MTLYEVLRVTQTAELTEIRLAYVALAREHHPDVAGGDDEAMRAVNEAWTTLSDPVRRAAYDRSLEVPARPLATDPPPMRTDEQELLDDLADDSPLGGHVVLPRWISMVPVAVFVLSIAVFFVGVFFSSQPALGAGAALFALSCALFLAAPFVALFSSRRRTAGGAADQSR